MRMFRVVVNGSEYKVGIEELVEATGPQPMQQSPAPAPRPASPQPAAKPRPTATRAEHGATGGTIVAPMPGTVLRVAASPGDQVTKGQTLLVLEAMKMENEIMAPANGVVEKVNVAQGGSVNAGEVLIVLSL